MKGFRVLKNLANLHFENKSWKQCSAPHMHSFECMWWLWGSGDWGVGSAGEQAKVCAFKKSSWSTLVDHVELYIEGKKSQKIDIGTNNTHVLNLEQSVL